MRPRLLDLFCGAGGAGMGYHQAGFEVVGVDLSPQPNYPCTFEQGDASAVSWDWMMEFDAIHASPPCHDHSSLSPNPDGSGALLAETVERLGATGLPWVVENVVGPDVAMAGWWFVLCGSMFGMQIQRHRRFGSSHLMLPPPCHHVWDEGRPYTITGNGNGNNLHLKHSLKPRSQDFWRFMEMPWMEGQPHYGVAQAIPPAYTRFIGEQLLQVVAA